MLDLNDHGKHKRTEHGLPVGEKDIRFFWVIDSKETKKTHRRKILAISHMKGVNMGLKM
jgi:hypothetical protein